VEIRDSLNKNKKLGVGIGAAILVIAVGLIAFQLRGSGSGLTAATGAFYTDDIGKTFFTDDPYKVSPFDHGGKQAYRADVFKCADGKQFVGLIYRHNQIGRKQIEEYVAKGQDDEQGTILSGIERFGMEVKRAGTPDNAWRPNDDPDNLRRSVPCPGGTGAAYFVTP